MSFFWSHAETFQTCFCLASGNPQWLTATFLHKLQQPEEAHPMIVFTEPSVPFLLSTWKVLGVEHLMSQQEGDVPKCSLAGSCAARMTNSAGRTWPHHGQAQPKEPLALQFQALWQALAEPLQGTSLLTKPLAHFFRGILECQSLK